MKKIFLTTIFCLFILLSFATIRTFRGATNSDWNTATNWLEGAVPLTTDSVIFDVSSPASCTFSNNGICLSLITTGYTGTINTNTYYLQVGNGNITLASTTIMIGTLNWYATASSLATAPGLNANSANLTQLILGIYGNANTYCKLLNDIDILDFKYNMNNITSKYFTCATFGLYTIYIERDMYYYINVGNGFSNINLYFRNNCTLYNLGFYTLTSLYNPITFNGIATLSGDLCMNISTVGGYTLTVTATGSINCNNYYLILIPTYQGGNPITAAVSGIILANDISIDNLSVYASAMFISAWSYQLILPTQIITVNKNLAIQGCTRIDAMYIRSQTPNVQANINIGASCNYYILHTTLKDIIFNRPIAGFNSVYTNCTNISNTTYPPPAIGTISLQ